MNGKTPLVSVIIPAYNAENYIREAIYSVLHQTYADLEIIVVNDGSTDRTEALVKELEDSRLTIITTNNQGQSAANNLGFSRSSGDFVKFFDADDILSPDHIQRQINRLLNNPDSVASSEVWRFWKSPATDALYEPPANWQDLEPLDWLILDEGKGLGMMPAGLFLFPSPIVKKAGGWDESLTLINDMEFCTRILLSSQKVLFCKDAKLFYRSGLQNNLSAQFERRYLVSSFKSLEKTTAMLLEQEDTARVKSVLARYWRLWSIRYFPAAPALYQKAEDWAVRLGGSDYFPFGGISLKLSKLFGWKMVRWLQFGKQQLISLKMALFAGRGTSFY